MGTLHSKLRRRHKTSPRLPVEVLIIVEEFLVGENSFRTAANLSIASRLVFQETASVLHAVTVWDYDHLVRMLSDDREQLMEGRSRSYVKLLVLESMPPWSKKVVDTLSDPAIFPNLKALFCDIKPFSLRPPPPFDMDCKVYYDRHGATLTVFAPISCASVVDVLQSLVKCYQRPVGPRSVMHKLFLQAPTVSKVHVSRLRVSRIRFKPGGALLEPITKRGVSKLEAIVNRYSFEVDLGNEPIPNMTGGLAEAVESYSMTNGLAKALECYSRMVDAHPDEYFWMYPSGLTVVCQSSLIPPYMTALARGYSGQRGYRHQITVHLDSPPVASWVDLLDQWVGQYLIARRQFYVDPDPADVNRLAALLKQNETFDWHGAVGTRSRSRELQRTMVEPMVTIRISGHRRLLFLIWNADRLLPGGETSVNVLGAILEEGFYEKLYH